MQSTSLGVPATATQLAMHLHVLSGPAAICSPPPMTPPEFHPTAGLRQLILDFPAGSTMSQQKHFLTCPLCHFHRLLNSLQTKLQNINKLVQISGSHSKLDSRKSSNQQ
ncbi:hypothetical protein TNCV_3359321 [Trichonephila clavipes]|nr:hypothetical protein TNCV_3359321 [Trichonephila clavipes]